MLLGGPSASSGPGGQNAKANRAVEAEFSRWAKAVGLCDFFRAFAPSWIVVRPAQLFDPAIDIGCTPY
jgi:hypothetical protein